MFLLKVTVSAGLVSAFKSPLPINPVWPGTHRSNAGLGLIVEECFFMKWDTGN